MTNTNDVNTTKTYLHERDLRRQLQQVNHRYSPKRGFHVYYPLSTFSNFTPNTWYTKYTFFHVFFQNWEKKRVIGVEQSVPIKLWVIGVSDKSQSCLGLGYTETCCAIKCHLKNFDASYWNSFPPFFCQPMGSIKMFQVTHDAAHPFQCKQALARNP